MKRFKRVLIVILLLFLIANFIINAQQEPNKCPPTCTAENINDDSYKNQDSYNNEDFYKNSDPNKWDYNKVVWNKVPLNKIPEVPTDKIVYAELNNEQKMILTVEQIKTNFDKIDNLNDVNLERTRKAISEKYQVTVGDFGESASFKNGVLQANFGKQEHVTVSNEVYKDGFLTITKNGEIVFIPKKEITNLHIPKGDALTIKNLENPSNFQDYKVKGTFKVNDDNTITFLKGQTATIDAIEVNPILNDVSLCKTRSVCSGNYLFLSKKELSAEGKGFSIRFLGGNNYLNVFDSEGFYNAYSQNDFKKIYLGNDEKKGKIEIKTKENLLPEIKTDGWVRIENDENILTIDGKHVKKDLFKKSIDYRLYSAINLESTDELKAKRGSVNSAVIADNDNKKVYISDESQNLHILDRNKFEITNNYRESLSEKYGLSFTGYFSNLELVIFSTQLGAIENEFEIDFKKMTIKYEEMKFPIEIIELDKRMRDVAKQPEAFVDFQFPQSIFWVPFSDLSNSQTGRRIGLSKWTPPSEKTFYYRDVLAHELGHVVDGLSSPHTVEERINNIELIQITPLSESFKKKAEEFGVKFVPEFDENKKYILKEEIVSGPDDLFPTDYSKTELSEMIAEYAKKTFNYQDWFTDPQVSKKIRNQRQALRDVFLEELKKYKKTE